jgi:hypothetical protein
LPVFDGREMVAVIALTFAGAVPPVFVFPLNVIAAFHCAYSVIDPVDEYVVKPDAYEVPEPLAVVFHPSNTKFVFSNVVGAAKVVLVLPFAVVAAGTVPISDVCPLPL